MPLFSTLWTAAGDNPARSASCASDQPRSARALATLAPISETVRSISGSALGAEAESVVGSVGLDRGTRASFLPEDLHHSTRGCGASKPLLQAGYAISLTPERPNRNNGVHDPTCTVSGRSRVGAA